MESELKDSIHQRSKDRKCQNTIENYLVDRVTSVMPAFNGILNCLLAGAGYKTVSLIGNYDLRKIACHFCQMIDTCGDGIDNFRAVTFAGNILVLLQKF